MFNGWLTNVDIDNIHNEVKNYLPGEKSAFVSKAGEYIELVFEKWQIEHGVKPKPGLLYLADDSNDVDNKLSEEDIQKYKPWQCAGWGVANKIDLALKLWVDDYGAFHDAEERLGIFNIIAIVLLETKDPTHSSSIFRAYNLIQQNLIWQLKYKLTELNEEKKQRSVQAKEAQYVSTIKRREKASENKKFILRENEVLLNNPASSRKSLRERASIIANACARNGITKSKDKNYSERYIQDLITNT